MSLTFEWDPEKSEINLKKHKVSFEEATTVFADPLSLTISDPLHSIGEQRFVITGKSYHGRALVVIHTERGDNIRIISARLVTSKEKAIYEKKDPQIQ